MTITDKKYYFMFTAIYKDRSQGDLIKTYSEH